VEKIRPNKANLATKREWIYKPGGIIQFTLQLMQVRFPGLTANFKLVLLAVMDRIRPKGEGGAFPGLGTIAQDAGVCRRTAIRAIQYWKDRGVLTWTPKHGLHRNEYTLLKSPLLLRVAVTVKVDVQSAKLALAKVPNSHFEQCQIVTLRHTKGSQTRVTNGAAAPCNTIRGAGSEPGEDGGTGHAYPLIPRAPLPPAHHDKNELGCLEGKLETPQDASGGVGSTRNATRTALTKPAGASAAVQAALEGSGSFLEGDMSWRSGGYNTGGKAATDPRTGEDAMAKAEKTKKPGFKHAIVVWSHLRERAKARGMDVPEATHWALQDIQKLVDTDGYGMDKVMEMATALVDHWQSIQAKFKLRVDQPTAFVLTRWAAELRNAKTTFLGRGAQWASPDVGEEAKKAVAIQRAERLAALEAKKAKLPGEMV
jgi:hypothetical protein